MRDQNVNKRNRTSVAIASFILFLAVLAHTVSQFSEVILNYSFIHLALIHLCILMFSRADCLHLQHQPCILRKSLPSLSTFLIKFQHRIVRRALHP